MNHLPDDVLKIIWEFDDTYRKEYKKCMDQIEKSRELHNEVTMTYFVEVKSMFFNFMISIHI